MNILVTGATGFIGNHVVKELLKSQFNVYCLVRSSSSVGTLEKEGAKVVCREDIDLVQFLKENEIEGIIHLASLFLSAHKSEDIAPLVNSNILFGLELLEASSKSSVKWFLNTGTFWQHYNDAAYSPVNLYAATKQAFEDLMKYYTETNQIMGVTLKLSDSYGPGDTRKKIFKLFHEMAESGSSLDMSAGEQKISINYIDDIVSAFIKLTNLLISESPLVKNGEDFNVTSSEVMSLKNIAKLFEEVCGKKLNINWGLREYREREVMIPWTDQKVVPGWEQKFSLKEGIKEYLKGESFDS
ncbi:NAD(P)-dependent oxidoreductase [Halobacteriovorax sp. GB3]|uniref:NAD-dependent epimerase/dehydratase family protein n=1 Tax=Halobacteriovorax sp. GB3 TaxID=2719615 RepID=UPI00235EF08C|nr:NAD(P)-dependent oxidoreductase [Halobacteriovorax sp. GB3]MDD0852539.1 NAD(P)-dependent oxidoreductase [Halobacteriovorax sp. GB3]